MLSEHKAFDYKDKSFDQDTIDTLNPLSVDSAKRSKMSLFRENKIFMFVAAGCTALFGACAALNFMPEMSIFMGSLSALTTLAYGWTARNKLQDAQALDVIHYLRTGDESKVVYKRTVEKALATGLRIGQPGDIAGTLEDEYTEEIELPGGVKLSFRPR